MDIIPASTQFLIGFKEKDWELLQRDLLPKSTHLRFPLFNLEKTPRSLSIKSQILNLGIIVSKSHELGLARPIDYPDLQILDP